MTPMPAMGRAMLDGAAISAAARQQQQQQP